MSEMSKDVVNKTLRAIYGQPDKHVSSTEDSTGSKPLRNLVDEALRWNREAANAPNPLRRPRTS